MDAVDTLLRDATAHMREVFSAIGLKEGLDGYRRILENALHASRDSIERDRLERALSLLNLARHGITVGDAVTLTQGEYGHHKEIARKLKEEYDALSAEYEFFKLHVGKLRRICAAALDAKTLLDESDVFFWVRPHTDPPENVEKLKKVSSLVHETEKTLRQLLAHIAKADPAFETVVKQHIRDFETLATKLLEILSLVHKHVAATLTADEQSFLLDANTVAAAAQAIRSNFEGLGRFIKQLESHLLSLESRVRQLHIGVEEIVKDITTRSSEDEMTLRTDLRHLIHGNTVNVLQLGIPLEMQSGVVSVMSDLMRHLDRRKFRTFTITHWFDKNQYFDRFRNVLGGTQRSPYNLIDEDGRKVKSSYDVQELLLHLRMQYQFVPNVIHLHTHTFAFDRSLATIITGLGSPPVAYTLHQVIPLKPLTRDQQDDLLGGRLIPAQLEQIKDKYYEGAQSGQRDSIAKADVLITISDMHKAALGVLFPECKDRIYSIPNGSDIFEHSTDEARREATTHRSLYAPAGQKIILCVGRIEKQKRIDILCHAFNTIFAHHPDTVLLFVGAMKRGKTEEKERGALIALLQSQFGLDPHAASAVRFAPWVPQPQLVSYYLCGDVLVYPLLERDLYSIVVIEALELGVPVITGPSGYSLCGSADSAGNIVAAYENFLGNEVELKRRFAALKREVRERYSLKRFIEDHQRIYADLALRRKARPQHLTTPEFPFITPSARVAAPPSGDWRKDVLFSFDGAMSEAARLIETLEAAGIEQYRFYVLGSSFFSREALRLMNCEFSNVHDREDVPVSSDVAPGKLLAWIDSSRQTKTREQFVQGLFDPQALRSAKWIVGHFKETYGNRWLYELEQRFGYHATILHPPVESPLHIANLISDDDVVAELRSFEWMFRLLLDVPEFHIRFGRTPSGGGFRHGDNPVTRAKSKRLEQLANRVTDGFSWRMWRADASPRSDPSVVAEKVCSHMSRPVVAAWWDAGQCEILMHTREFATAAGGDFLKALLVELKKRTGQP